MNMKSQINVCSYGKLKFAEPKDNHIYPNVVGGVVTVTLNKTVTGISDGTVLGWLRTEIPLYAAPLDSYNHVMYFMPPGVDFGGAAAFGYVPGRETVSLNILLTSLIRHTIQLMGYLFHLSTSGTLIHTRWRWSNTYFTMN